MALSPSLRSKAFNHNRSLSLPSKSNPAFSQFEEALSIVRASEGSCSSLSSMNNALNGLKTLYCKTGELIQLPHTQRIISQKCQEKWIDQVLDGHVNILDACMAAKDHVSQTKQNVQDLLSAIRRRDMDNIRCYLDSRRKSKKSIQKSLKHLRIASRSKPNIIASLEKDEETVDLVYMLKDAEFATITTLESLLSYLIGTSNVRARQSGWPLILPKLITSSKKIVSQQNEFDIIDNLLQTSLEDVQTEEIVNDLKGMDSSIQNLEEELDCLFRQLIKTRVFLLNLLNH